MCMLIYTQTDKRKHEPSFRLRRRERSKTISPFNKCLAHIILQNLTLLHLRDTISMICQAFFVTNQGAGYPHGRSCHPTAPARHFTTTSLCTFETSGFHFLHRYSVLTRSAFLLPIREITRQNVCACMEPYANPGNVHAS
jgi:hypothetical protein